MKSKEFYFYTSSCEVIFIGSGTPKEAKKFQENYPDLKKARIFVDPSLRLYSAFKTQKFYIPNLKSWMALKRATDKGYKQGPLQGSPNQLGGTWLIDNSKVLYEHIGRF